MNHEWNVLSTVVAVVCAPTWAAAQEKLEAQLDAAGFAPYDTPRPAFHSESCDCGEDME